MLTIVIWFCLFMHGCSMPATDDGSSVSESNSKESSTAIPDQGDQASEDPTDKRCGCDKAWSDITAFVADTGGSPVPLAPDCSPAPPAPSSPPPPPSCVFSPPVPPPPSL